MFTFAKLKIFFQLPNKNTKKMQKKMRPISKPHFTTMKKTIKMAYHHRQLPLCFQPSDMDQIALNS